jgi:hypothetical protein
MKQSKNKNDCSTFITAKFQELLSAFLRTVYGISVSLNTRNVVCDENDIHPCLTPIKTMKLEVCLHRYHQGFVIYMQFQVGAEFHTYSHKSTHSAHSLKGFTNFFSWYFIKNTSYGKVFQKHVVHRYEVRLTQSRNQASSHERSVHSASFSGLFILRYIYI